MPAQYIFGRFAIAHHNGVVAGQLLAVLSLLAEGDSAPNHRAGNIVRRTPVGVFAVPADQVVTGLDNHLEVFLILIDPGLPIEAVENGFYDGFILAVAKARDQVGITLDLLILSPRVATMNGAPIHRARHKPQEPFVHRRSEAPYQVIAAGQSFLGSAETGQRTRLRPQRPGNR